MKRLPTLRVVAVNILYGCNLGYIARVMKNFNIQDLHLVNVKPAVINDSLKYCAHGCEIILKAKKTENILKAIDKAELVIGTTAIKAKSKDNLLRRTISPIDFAELYYKREGIVALLLGRESTGLTNEELQYCDSLVNISANPIYPTLNVSHTAAILFYQIYSMNYIKKIKIASRKEYDIICDVYSQLCKATKIPDHRKKIAEQALRNIVARSSPTPREITVLISPLRRALHLLDD